MNLGLTGKKALILGSSSGLGLAIARKLVEEGAEVAISGRNPERAEKAVKTSGAKLAVTGDLTISGDAQRIVDEAANALHGLDIIVINTGGGSPGGLLEMSPEACDKAYNSMLRPAMEAAIAASQHLKKSASGRMIFITARSVVEATPELALSSVFRSGVSATARSLALELAPKVLVNIIIPGQFDTPAYGRFAEWASKQEGKEIEEVRAADAKANPLGRLGQADEFADVVTFICSGRSSFINGSVIRVDGGAVTGFH